MNRERMTRPDASEVKAFILSELKTSLAVRAFEGHSIPDDLDLRAHGVIDSLGFIHLLAALEARFGGPIDLTDVAPEELTRVDVLCRRVAGNTTRHHAG